MSKEFKEIDFAKRKSKLRLQFVDDAFYDTEKEKEDNIVEENHEFDDYGLSTKDFQDTIRNYCKKHTKASYQDIQEALRKKAEEM